MLVMGTAYLMGQKGGGWSRVTATITITLDATVGANTIHLRPVVGAYQCKINWGDGEVTACPVDGGNVVHSYVSAGVKKITISGSEFDTFYVNNQDGKEKYIGISQSGEFVSRPTDFSSCFYGCCNLTAIPSGLFEYNAEVTTFEAAFKMCLKVTSIPANLFKNSNKVTNYSQCFQAYDNTDPAPEGGLNLIPTGLFDNCPEVTSFQGCFRDTEIASIPANLFKHNTKVEKFDQCFSLCKKLVAIPIGIFDNCTVVTSFSDCFHSSGVEAIPTGMFDNCPEVTSFRGCFTQTSVKTIPTNLFRNNLKVKSFASCFYWTKVDAIPVDLFKYNTKVTDFGGCFSFLEELTLIPPGLFDNCPEVTSFWFCFGCTGITNIPIDLFKRNTKVEKFDSCFSSCKKLVAIPTDLFKYNTEVIDFSTCFARCDSLRSAPPNLFKYNTKATDFSGCFHMADRLMLPGDLFGADKANRFIDATSPISFSVFFGVYWMNETPLSTAPDLWNFSFNVPPVTKECFEGHSTITLTNYNQIPEAWIK